MPNEYVRPIILIKGKFIQNKTAYSLHAKEISSLTIKNIIHMFHQGESPPPSQLL